MLSVDKIVFFLVTLNVIEKKRLKIVFFFFYIIYHVVYRNNVTRSWIIIATRYRYFLSSANSIFFLTTNSVSIIDKKTVIRCSVSND